MGNAPGVTRTPDPRIRNPMLYPAELRALNTSQRIGLARCLATLVVIPFQLSSEILL
jgi:hypothetical protein